MPRNGSGTYTRPHDWTTDAGNGLNISSSRMDADSDDMATAITNSLAKDGQTTPTANLPMGGFRHTNVGVGSARTHYLQIGQHQDGGTLYGGTAGGTANAITATLAPAITAYATGQTFSFKAASANTSTTTVNFNGVGAKTIKRADGSNLQANDIKSGALVTVQYDGTNMQLVNAANNGTLLAVQTFTADGTYTPTAGATKMLAYIQAAGGGGAGRAGTGTALGGGGGGGAGAVYYGAVAGGSVTVGAGGAGGDAATGTSGGNSVFAGITCTGGAGGAYNAVGNGNNAATAGGAGGTVSAGSPTYSVAGQAGGAGISNHQSTDNLLIYISGKGGDSMLGLGGASVATILNAATGKDGTGYGSGGSGSGCGNAGGNAGVGGDGMDGIVVIYEFA